MANVNERITIIKDYFLGMDVKDGIIDVVVKFPSKWSILDGLEDKYGIFIISSQEIEGSQYANEENSYYFGAQLTDGFDVIFDAIDENVKIMIQAEERAKLLEQKIQELTNIFNDKNNSLDVLKSLEFSFRKKGGRSKSVFQEKQNTQGNNNNIEMVEEEIVCQAG